MINETEAIQIITEIFPTLYNLGFILWNWTSFPFWDGDDPIAHWVDQIEEYLEKGN